MYFPTSFTVLAAAASTAQAFQLSDIKEVASNARRDLFSGMIGMITGKQAESCPAVWQEISATLSEQFLADGQCTDAARAAIRASFHDCFNGACDGSLILADECWRPENAGLERVCDNLGHLAEAKNVSTADLIQFAAAHAIKTCPGGPTVPVKVGRKDSDTASPENLLPRGHAKSADLIKQFALKGFSAIDLAALIGAHTAAKQRTTDPSQSGVPLDSTPGQWDNKYYSETLNGKAPFVLPSDKDVSQNVLTTGPFRTFASSQGAWAAAFVPAMEKLSMIGVDRSGLIDCTAALPGGSKKRDVRNAPLWDRLRW